ncbi:hypothetical protein Murru_0694 [Allomuricauda ruestringensis DSM 13258]|uniref:DUF5723 domain-containing protein n=1 Tax=Allomuricauda ruestringensis (strain DSM 13258 / CIP 107369 / LMG 19739 / B1) TaxID=886377 RepID=G2PRU9_ALLRU|nr:DUF5723 family protein [Allomuricauda ruestringensis]AEM69744.1 hypothetical protein Murru_0694 [Allomuricauda ruestringensis DSM 13258]
MRIALKLILIALFCSTTVLAQNKELLYDFYEIPQSLMVNPGVKTSQKWHAGIPVISGLSVQGATSGVTVNDLFANDGVDFTTKVQERLLDVMRDKDDFSTTSQIEGITVGFRGKNRPDDYYSFGMYGEMDIISYWPKDLAILAFEGNGGNNIGRSFDLGDLNLRGEMINVFHFGINRKVSTVLTLGARAKIYSSIFQFQSINNSGSFTTRQGQNNVYESTINADMELQTAGIKEFYDIIEEDTGTTQKDLASVFTERVLLGGNLGLGFDFGFSYNLNPQTTITGSVLDIGFINNSKDVWNYTFSGSTTTDGISVFLPEDINNVNNDLWQELIDEIDGALPHGENQSSYISLRPIKVYGSVRHDFGEGGERPLFENCGCAVNGGGGSNRDYYRNSVGGQLFMMKRPRGVQAALTGFYQRRFGRTASLKATYTVDKYSFTNIGLGANLQLGPVNFYVLADNLLSYSNVADSHYASLQFGFNIISWNSN